ncbi:MAG: hypothetical protein INQ03_11315 [Candidatus Heimdallarchaeota archaeon]|nr:hypothetical protein [Candidatus Heimdallarchaeota archaeon]
MDYDDEIDRLEARFRDPDFRESLDEDGMDTIQEQFSEISRILYNVRKVKKMPEFDGDLDEIESELQMKIRSLKDLVGIR